MANAHLHAVDSSGNWVPLRVTATGGLVGSEGDGLTSGHPAVVALWSYAVSSGGITDTADVMLVAAAGAGRSNYLTSMQICNTSATATEVVIKTGSTVLWRCLVGASMTRPAHIEFLRPLISDNNTAITAACITTATETYINAQGYQDATIEQLRAQQTAEHELFDMLGVAITDAAGVIITVDGPYLSDVYPIVSGAWTLLGTEPNGVAMDFRDLSYLVRDTVTGANNKFGDVNDWLTYTAPSTKWILGANGLYSSGTTLRTEYNSSGTALGVRIEEARTNLLTYSNTFSDASWLKAAGGTGVVGTVTTVAGVAPDGSTSVETITLNRGAGNTISDNCHIAHLFTTVAASTYTGSIFVQAATAGDIGKQIAVRGAAGAAYTVVTLTAAWQRIGSTEVAAGTSSQLMLATRGTITTDNSVGVNLWVGQAELGSWASSPIVTTSATVTRAADNIGLTALPFPSMDAGGTMIVAWQPSATTLYRILQLRNSGGVDNTDIYYQSAVLQSLADDLGVSTTLASRAVTENVMHKAAYKFTNGLQRIALDGVMVMGDTEAMSTSFNRLHVGTSSGTVQHLTGHMAFGMLLPRQYSDAELQAVTT